MHRRFVGVLDDERPWDTRFVLAEALFAAGVLVLRAFPGVALATPELPAGVPVEWGLSAVLTGLVFAHWYYEVSRVPSVRTRREVPSQARLRAAARRVERALAVTVLLSVLAGGVAATVALATGGSEPHLPVGVMAAGLLWSVATTLSALLAVVVAARSVLVVVGEA